MEFTKVLAGDYNIRYISLNQKWYKRLFNGKFTTSKKMPIIKEYGKVNLLIVDDGIFGLRESKDNFLNLPVIESL